MRTKKSIIFAGLLMLLIFFPAYAARPTVKISASPLSIFVGGSSILTWTSTGATSASINQGIGTVPVNGSLSVSPTATKTYTITVKNGSGTTSAKATVTVKPVPPTVTFSATPSIIQRGQSSTLNWTTTNATSASINQGIGTVPLNGTKTGSPTATKTYTITVKGLGGTVTAQATVTVTVIPPDVTFSVDPPTIQIGESAELTWTSTYTTTVSIDNGIGSVALNGSTTITPSETTIYTLTAKGAGGTATAQVEVQVNTTPLPVVTLTAAPQTISPGEASLLCWRTENADSVSIDNGVGNVATAGTLQVTPTSTTTYTLTATGPGGTANTAVTVSVDDTLRPLATIYSSLEIVAAGGSTVLSWSSVHAQSASIDNGIGAVPVKGSLRVTPTQTTTYTLSIENQNGSASASTKVVVISTPRCFAYVPNSSGNSVSVVNTRYSGSVIKTIPVGTWPRGSVVSADGTRVYIGNTNSNSISVIDTGSNTVVSTISIGGGSKYLALHPGGRILYATLEKATSYAVAAIDTSTGQILKDLDLGVDYLGGIAVHPDGSKLYAASYGGDRVLVIDTASNAIVSQIPLRTPLELAVSPDGSRLYAIQGYDGHSNNISVVDTVTQAVVSGLSVNLPNGVQASLVGLEILPDGSKIYVSVSDDNSISVIDTSTLLARRAESFPGYSPKCLTATPDGSRVYVVFTNSNYLVYYYSSGDYVGGLINIGNYPHAYGHFIGYMAQTAAGKVTQSTNGVAGVTLTIVGEGVTRTTMTDAGGNFITALKNGTYIITPSKGNTIFSPQSRQVTIEQNLSGLDFSVIDPAVPPTVSLSASPATIQSGSAATLTWTSTNTATASIDNNVGTVPANSSISVTPATTTTYTITVSNTVLTATATALVTVTSPRPTAIITASPATIVNGGSSTLTWTTANATTASIDNGVGAVPVSGSVSVSPIATTTYTITATGAGGSANASVQVSVNNPYSAVLTGTVTDFNSGQPITGVLVTSLDSAGQSKNTQTDVAGKYTIPSLAPGNVQVSFTKSSYDLYQQTINIPANMTFELVTQLHQTLVGATLRGVVKDGQTNLPISGAMVTATYSGSSQNTISASDGLYLLSGIPLGTNTTITTSYTGYRSTTIQQTFSQAQVYVWDFVIYDASAVATINGKITNAKTLQPEEGVEVTFEGSNQKVITAANGTFVFTGIPLGEQTFYFSKADFVNESITYKIDQTPYDIDLIKPSRDSGQISIGQSISGIIQDAISLRPLSGATIRVPGIGMEAITDTDGNYQLSGLPVGNYPMTITATNHMALNFMVNVDIEATNQADFALIPLANGLIKGTITHAATGEPIDGASIEIEGSAMLAAVSEGDGTYKMVGVPPGTYKVLIINAEYADASVENVEVQDLTPTTVDLQLNKRPVTGALEGRILDNVTGNPVNGATVMISGTVITTTTDAGGNYRLANVPAGLNDIIVSAPGYPDSPRIRAVIADKDPSSPSTISSDIRIDAGNNTVDESVTTIITANEGGDIITKDSRFFLHIFPGTLSADAKITLKDASDGPAISIGSDLPLDPIFELEGIKASSVMTQIEIAPINAGDPIPTINGIAGFAIRYSQKDADTFQLDENTAFTYTWDGTNFTALDLRPYEFAVDKVNNIVFSIMDLSKTVTGSAMQISKKVLLKTDPHKSGAIVISGADIIIKILGKSLKNTIFPPKPKIKVYDKNELLAVINAPSVNIPHPNALPLLIIHGFDPNLLWYRETNPNKQGRYRLMLEDIVDASNGVYRPVFVSYNTQAKISSIAQSLSEKILGEFLNQKIIFKGIPSDPNNPASGTFPYLDTFGFSMGGLVSRTYIYFNRTNMVHNMTMIGTPNHGVFNCLKNTFENNPMLEGIVHILRPLNFGAADMLDYDDSSPAGFIYNPFLFQLNSSAVSSVIAPRGDINLFAGTDESAWLGLPSSLMPSPNDSLVTVKSVFCRPTISTLDSGLSLLNVQEPISKKYEHTKEFSHANIGKQEKRIREFSEELVKGFSDWTVPREYEDNDPDLLPDNIFVKPTADIGGYCKSKVKVEYNVWQPDGVRQSRDIDRIVLVIYHLDGNGHWHISEPKNGENGADINGNINLSKVEGIQGNSKRFSDNPLILSAVVNFDPNPPKGETGYDPEKDIVKVVPLVIPLRPDKMTVPLDPSKAQFRTPDLTE